MLTSLLAIALAGDLAVHTAGFQGHYSGATARGDLDLLLGERLRWTLGEGVRLWIDTRFLVDPSGPSTLERYRVRRLGVELTRGTTTVRLGRHPVQGGGPRLVDGLQVTHRIDAWEIGFWLGAAPDLFTTAPRARFGLGPTAVFSRSTLRATLTGELLFAPGGIDRASALATFRAAPSRRFAVDGRLDLELTGPHLADGRVGMQHRPTDALRFDLFYEAFSSLRYQRTATLDPEVRRFEARLLQGVDRLDGDPRDATLNHLVGAGAELLPPGEAPTPFVHTRLRYRYHDDPKNRFARFTTRAGLTRIDGLHTVAGLLTLRHVDAALQADLGLQTVFAFGGGCCQLDASAQVLLNPARYDGAGLYADLFVDLVGATGFTVGAGLTGTMEPTEVNDSGGAGFLRLTWRQRPAASAPRPEATAQTPRISDPR